MDRVDKSEAFSKGGSVNYKGAQVQGERGKFKGDVRGKFFTRSGGCLECAARGGGGSTRISNI